jgi:hypothetical protein
LDAEGRHHAAGQRRADGDATGEGDVENRIAGAQLPFGLEHRGGDGAS